MIELLILVTGLVALVKYNGASSALATGVEQKAKVFSESIILDAVEERQELNKQVEKLIETHGELVSHDELLSKLKV
jgi:hypothetical protein